MKRVVPFAALTLAFAGAFACSSNPEPETPDPSACASGTAPPGQFCPQPVATVTPTPTATATATQPSAQATPIPALAAAAATPVVQGMAMQEAPGMQPDGGPFAGQFQEGQTLEQAFNISPGKCYTVVAASVGIQELDIQLLAQPLPGAPPVPLAQDSTTGPTAVLGGKANGCWKNPTPLGGPGKIVLKATKGSGLAVAQVYIK